MVPPVSVMAERDESFLTRWSRRKRAGGAAPVIERDAAPVIEHGAAEDQAAPATVYVAPLPNETAPPDTPPAPPEDPPAELPDVESLDRDSDYTPFLRKGVPKHLARRAMRKLWRSDSLFGHLDGLDDYDEDFAAAFRETVGKAVKSTFKAVKDRTSVEAEAAEEAPRDGEPAEATADAAPDDEDRAAENGAREAGAEPASKNRDGAA